jgi:AhpD family alkylhydroperoxidase
MAEPSATRVTNHDDEWMVSDVAQENTMRVPAKSLSDYSWLVRIFFWSQKKKYGQVLEPAMLWGRSPKLFLGVAFLYGMIDRKSSPIEPALRSLITVRVSQVNECRFCMDLNSATLLKRGASIEKVEALDNWRHSKWFGEREQVALEFAEAVTRSDLSVSDELMDRLRRHFDDDAVIELTGLIAFQNLSSKFNSALGGPSPKGFASSAARERQTSGPPDAVWRGGRNLPISDDEAPVLA